MKPGESKSASMEVELRRGSKSEELPFRVQIVDEKMDEFVSEKLDWPVANDERGRRARARRRSGSRPPRRCSAPGAAPSAWPLATAKKGAVLARRRAGGRLLARRVAEGALRVRRGRRREAREGPALRRDRRGVAARAAAHRDLPGPDEGRTRGRGRHLQALRAPRPSPRRSEGGAKLRDVFVFVNEQKVFFKVVPRVGQRREARLPGGPAAQAREQRRDRLRARGRRAPDPAQRRHLPPPAGGGGAGRGRDEAAGAVAARYALLGARPARARGGGDGAAEARGAGARGVGARPRLHGHERVLRGRATRRSRSRPSTARSSSASRSSTRPTCTARSRTRSWSAARSRGRRDRVVLATKFGNERSRTARCVGVNGRPEYVRAALRRLAAAARRRPDRPLLPAPGRPERRRSRRRSARWPSSSAPGRSASSASPRRRPATIRRAHAVHPIAALQTEYSLWSRDPEDEILPTVRELGIGFVAYSPLGRGFLTGRFRQLEDLAAGRLPPQLAPLPGRELREEPPARGPHPGDRRREKG